MKFCAKRYVKKKKMHMRITTIFPELEEKKEGQLGERKRGGVIKELRGEGNGSNPYNLSNSHVEDQNKNSICERVFIMKVKYAGRCSSLGW